MEFSVGDWNDKLPHRFNPSTHVKDGASNRSFSINIRRSHENLVLLIEMCLTCVSKLGMNCKLGMSREVEAFVDADFCRNWSKDNYLDSNCMLSRK